MFTFFVFYFAVSQTGSTHEMFRKQELDMSMLKPKTTGKITVHRKKKVQEFPVSSRDVTNQTPPGQE